MRAATRDAALTPAMVFPPAFAKFVRVMPSGCWEWQGGTQSKHYGATNLILPGGRRLTLAHHVAMYYATGQVLLPGWIWMHTCDNRICVYQEHLLPATIGDNNKDMWRKGRDRYSTARAINARQA